MRLFLVLVFVSCLASSGQAKESKAKVIKVLPHYLDHAGRHALSPSLYERDAYQALLRRTPGLRAAIRFDVQWRARGYAETFLTLRLEVRGSNTDAQFQPTTFAKTEHPPRWFSRWSSILINEEDYSKLGDIIAWRMTLWDGEKLVAERQSFLW